MRILGVLTAMVLLVISQPVSATPLNLGLNSDPDIYSAFINVAYDSVLDEFSADGWAINLTVGGVTTPISAGLFELDAIINDAGVLSGGTVSITGTTSTPNFTSPLLTGSIVAFGFVDTVDEDPEPFEFLVETAGGSLMAIFGPEFGVTLSVLDFENLPTNPSGGTVFGSDFATTSFMGVSDAGVPDSVAPIPEPSGSVLALVGWLVAGQQLRRQRVHAD